MEGVGRSAVSDAQGHVEFCMAYDVPTTISVTDTTAPTTYLEEVVVTPAAADAGAPGVLADGLLLLPYELLAELVSVLSLPDAGLQTTGAFIITEVISASGTSCPNEAGWTFGLTLTDGGTFADGGDAIPFVPAYFDSFGVPALGSSQTANSGSAILFNIDPSIANAAVLTATNPAPGACPLVQGALRPTGRVTIGSSAGTYAPLLTP